MLRSAKPDNDDKSDLLPRFTSEDAYPVDDRREKGTEFCSVTVGA